MERGGGRIVDHVGEHAAFAGGEGHGAIHGVVVGGRDREPGAVEPGRIERAIEVFDAADPAQRRQRRTEGRRPDPNDRPGREQRLCLARGDRATADHQHGLAAQVGEQGEQRRGHGGDLRRTDGRTLAPARRLRK
jgi:hypothetical protein